MAERRHLLEHVDAVCCVGAGPLTQVASAAAVALVTAAADGEAPWLRPRAWHEDEAAARAYGSGVYTERRFAFPLPAFAVGGQGAP